MKKDVEYFRREYFKQKILEQTVNSRVLKRPKIKKWQVAILFAILPFLISASVLIPIFVKIGIAHKALIGVALMMTVSEIYLRFCLLSAVKCYQHYADEQTRRRCKCIPSCSEYAVLSLQKVFPLIVALIKIRKRLFRTCNGEEYLIDFPKRKWNEQYEKKVFHFSDIGKNNRL